MRKTLGLFAIKILSAVLTYSANAIVTNYLSTEDAGYYFLFTSIILLFSGVSKLGLDLTSLREVAVYRSRGDINGIKHFNVNTLALLLFTGLIISIPVTVLTYFYVPKTSAVALVGITLLLFTGKEVISGMLRGLQRYYQAGFVLTSSIPLGVTIFFGVCYFLKLKANPFLGYLFCVVFCISAGVIFLYKNNALAKISFKNIDLRGHFKRIDRNYYLLAMFLLAINWLPNVVVGTFMEKSIAVKSVAIFNVVNRTAIIISFIYIAVEMYVAPKIAHHFAKDEMAQIQSLLIKTSKLSFVISTLVVVVALFASKMVLRLFGAEYAQHYILFDIMAVAQYINVLTGSGATFMTYTQRQKTVRNVFLITVITILVAMPIVSHFAGLLYATICYGIIVAGYNLALTIIAKVRYKTRVTFLVPNF